MILSIMTLGVTLKQDAQLMTFSTMAFSIITSNITTCSKTTLTMTIKHDIQHNDTWYNNKV
jgi:hypothetical protein